MCKGGPDLNEELVMHVDHLFEIASNNCAWLKVVAEMFGCDVIALDTGISIKGSDDVAFADSLAKEMVAETSASIKLPTDAVKFSISLGIAIYHGQEKNYSEIFKKADIALYKTKADRKMHYCIYKEQ